MMKKIKALSIKEKKTLLEKMVKLQEEVGELAEAVLIHQKASGTHYKNAKDQSILDESVDVILVALSIYFSHGGTLENYRNLLKKKSAKWDKFQT